MHTHVEILEDRRLLSSAPLHLQAIHQSPQVVYPSLSASLTHPFYSAIVGFQFAAPATQSQLLSLNPSAVVHWGDGHSSTATVVETAAGVIEFRAGHDYAKPGRYRATIRVRGAAVGAEHVVIDVRRQTPNGFKLKGIAGKPFTGVLGSFIPANPIGSAIILWGDRTTSVTAISASDDGSYSASGAHTYAKPGRYLIQVVYMRTTTPLGPEFPTVGVTATIKVAR